MPNVKQCHDSYLIHLKKEPDADQGGCRNRYIYSETGRKPEYQECREVQNHKAKE